MESADTTQELLASLFEDPEESKIRHVKKKTRPKSAAGKNSTDVRSMKDVQQRTPSNRRERKTRPSGSEMKARSTKKKTQVRKPVAAEVVPAEDPGIKPHVQEKRPKTVTEKRSAPVKRKREEKKITETSMVKEQKPAVSEGGVRPSKASSYPQRRPIFGSTTLNMGLAFAMGVLLTLLGTRYVSLDFLDSHRGVVLAENVMVTDPPPEKQDVPIPTVSAVTVDTGEQENESKTAEPPPVGPEKETIAGSNPRKPDTPPVSETFQENVVSAKQESTSAESTSAESTSADATSADATSAEGASANPGLSVPIHSREASRTGTFQRDGIKSYPYSVYFGSYKHADGAQEVISSYEEKGVLSPYWVKVDLGEKGVWYRVLAGYFQTKDEVETYIDKHQLTEGKSRHVLYANLIGHYRSDEELSGEKLSLSKLGYCPYVITTDDGESFLYTGAFYHKADAEKERFELASKGIQAQIVKR
jgi:hypothetical protein